MIIDLPSTKTTDVVAKLVSLRADAGSMALSRVLTLVVVVHETDAEAAIETANAASRQHPCRIVVVVAANARGAPRLDAQIRLGGDAGASEVVVLRLYGTLAKHGRSAVTPLLLADSPIVAWWPVAAPKNPSADPVGAMAARRVTDVAAAPGRPRTVLGRLAAAYADGDTDLSWARITLWRAQLAAALDQAPYEPVTAVTITSAADSPSGELLAAWLAARLRCPVSVARSREGTGIVSVRMERASGNLDLVRPQGGETATLTQAGHPDRSIALHHRSDAECLADELRRLDPDEVYREALTVGMSKVSGSRRTASEAVRAGDAPNVAEAEKAARRIRRRAKVASSATMVDRERPPDSADTDVVRDASARRLAEVSSEQEPS